MTLVPHWHSAIYGLQQFVSNFGMFLAFMTVWMYVLNTSKKLVTPIPEKLYNYMAQMMLAFTLLWVYTFYSQYLTIWYGDIPDETDRVFGMINGNYAFLWWSVLVLKFVIPFTVFCFPVPRHNVVAINTVAICIIVGTLFERYVWIGGINGSGSYPIIAFVVVGAIVSLAGYVLVGKFMQAKSLIKG